MTQFFLGAFPDMKEVYRKNDEATLADFVDPDRMVFVNRRALMSYDVLIQPDILKIFRLLDPACPLRQQVNLSKNEAEVAAREAREEIRRRHPSLAGCEERPDIRPLATRIIWGTYSLFQLNRLSDVLIQAPHYISVRKSIKSR